MKFARRSGEELVVSDSATARFLHVANGSCTTDIIEAARLPGTRSIWADPLYEGPVPAGLSDDELLDVRARYLAGPDEHATVHPMNDLRVWRHVIADHESYDELVLWFEHDLFDQLNLIQLLTWIRGRPCQQGSEPGLHRVVSRPSAIQGSRRVVTRGVGPALRHAASNLRRRVEPRRTGMGGIPPTRS